MSALSWPTVENAWVAAVRAALGGSAALAILWAHHLNPYVVDPPVVILKIEKDSAVDRGEARDYYIDGRPLNEEIDHETTRFFLVTLSVDLRVSAKNATGANSPHALSTLIRTYLAQDGVQETLQAAGIGLVDDGESVYPAELINGVWVPTAKFPVRFYAAISAVERIGYLATYEGTVAQTPPDPGAPAMPFSSTPPYVP